ncbi:MAG: iron ABC transporter permease [Acetobacteraceae bacterium]|nr:iron ABC transporter permease [Acetobacteraceae bacterium]
MSGAAVARRGRPPIFTLLAAALVGALCLVFAYPMLFALVQAATTVAAAPAGAMAGWSVPELLRVLRDTCIVVGGGGAIALAAGGAIACLNERTDAALGAIGDLLPLIPLLLPPIAGVIGWAVLLDPSAGLLNAAMRTLLTPVGLAGDSGPLNIYTMPGLVAMTGLSLVPYVYLIVAAALRHLDPAIEEAARVCGMRPFRVLLRVTLPSVAPALAAAFLVALVAGLGLFSVPIVLGTGARIEVISVTIFRLLNSYPPNTAAALVMAVLLSLAVQALLWAQGLIAPEARRAALGGRGMRTAPLRLGKWRHPARAFTILYLLLTGVLPIAAIALTSLQQFWSPVVDWAGLTLDNYREVLLSNATTRQALFNSFGLGSLVATLTIVIAAIVILPAGQGGGRIRHIASRVMTLPATVPHTFVGVSLLLAFSVPPLRLYGSVALLGLAYLILSLPFSAQTVGAVAGGIGRELPEAARVAGAGEGRTFGRVLLPLALPGLLAGWIIVFVQSADELTASAFLSGPSNPVIGRVLMDFWVFGNFPEVAALALIMTLVNVVCIAVMRAFSRYALRRAR